MRVLDRDDELLGVLRRRDSSAANRLVATYGDRAYRLALRITGSGQDAEEVVQDAFWTVIQKIDTFRGESAFGSWLYRIVANTAYQKLRTGRARRRDVPLDEVLAVVDAPGQHGEPVRDWSMEIDDPCLQGELRAVLASAIDGLPADYRMAVVLHDIEGLSNPEIAETLGISLPNVKSRVHRARLLLRSRLASYMADAPASACLAGAA
jgi:RNA polymerase sigma-70 factor (ECF subfamily)